MTRRDIYTFRLVLAIIFGYWEMAEILVDSLEPFITNDGFVVRAGLRRTATALACLKLFRINGRRKHKTTSRKIMQGLEKESKHGNVNAHPLYLMLLSEESPSKEKYENGIRACARLGLVHFEAYLCERAAEFFLKLRDEGWAEYYMEQAFVLYEDWGAHGKASRLKEEHSELLKSSNFREKATTALKGRSRYSSEHVDLLKDFDWQRLSSMSSISVTNSDPEPNKRMSETGSGNSTDDSSELSGEHSSSIPLPSMFSASNPMS